MSKEVKTTGEARITILLLEAEKLREKSPSAAVILDEAALDLADKIRKRNEKASTQTKS